MSSHYQATCNSCGYEFTINIGHGFFFRLGNARIAEDSCPKQRTRDARYANQMI